MGKKISNMVGSKYGRLTVVERAEDHIGSNGQRKIMWLCKCDCGNEKIIRSDSLRDGHTKSCGCLNREAYKKVGIANRKHFGCIYCGSDEHYAKGYCRSCWGKNRRGTLGKSD